MKRCTELNSNIKSKRNYYGRVDARKIDRVIGIHILSQSDDERRRFKRAH